MKLQDLLFVCLLCLTGTARCDGNSPAVIIVEEGTDVLLPCSLSTKENIESKFFDWWKVAQKNEPWKQVFTYDDNNGGSGQSQEFKGRVSHFQDELKHGNASIVIRNTKLTDSGNYDCAFPRFQPPQKFNVELLVAASPKPNIRIRETKDGSLLLLECEVFGAFPKPEVEWRNRAGNKLPAAEPQVTESGGKFNIILNITVTEPDDYTCVSTQEELNHQISDKIFVIIHVLSTGLIVAVAVLGTLLVGVVVYVLKDKRCFTRKQQTDGEDGDRNKDDVI